jgi:hypothetical protein
MSKDLAMAREEAKMLEEGLISVEEAAEGMSSIEVPITFEIEDQSVIDEAQRAGIKAADEFREAIQKGLKQRAGDRLQAKVDLAVDKILLKKGLLQTAEMQQFFADEIAQALETAKIKEIAKTQGITEKEAKQLLANARALSAAFPEVTKGLKEAEIVDIGATALQAMKEQLAREKKAAADSKKNFEEAQKARKKREKEEEQAEKELAAAAKRMATKRRKTIEAAEKFNEAQAKSTFAAISAGLAGVRKLFSGDFFGAIKDALSAAAKGLSKALGAAAGTAGIPPGLVEDAAGTVFGIFTTAATAVQNAIKKSIGAATGFVGSAFDAVLSAIGDQRLTGAVDFVKRTFGGVIDSAKGFASTLASVGAALLPLIGPIVATFIVVAATLTAIGVTLGILFTGIATLFAALAIVIGGAVVALGTLGAALVAAVVVIGALLTGTFGALVAAVTGAVGAVMSAFAAVNAAIFSFVTAIASAVAGLALVGALVVAFGFLATKTKAFGKIQDRFSKAIDRVVEALEPAVASLEPLAVIFDSLVSVLVPFATQLGAILILFKEEIFAAAKFVAISFATLAIAGLEASNAILGGSQFLLRGLAAALSMIDDGLEAIGLDKQFEGFTSSLESAADELENFKIDTMPMKTALDELGRLTIGAAEQRIRREGILSDEEKKERKRRAKEKALAAAREASGLDEVSK